MKIEFEGRTWDFESEVMDVKQATVLYMTYQLNIAQYSDGFDALDQRVYHFAYWLMLQQNGVVKTIAECNPQIIDFIAAVTEARVAESVAEAEAAKAKAKAEPDPTGEPSSPTDSAASPESSTPTGTGRPRRNQQHPSTA